MFEPSLPDVSLTPGGAQQFGTNVSPTHLDTRIRRALIPTEQEQRREICRLHNRKRILIECRISTGTVLIGVDTNILYHIVWARARRRWLAWKLDLKNTRSTIASIWQERSRCALDSNL